MGSLNPNLLSDELSKILIEAVDVAKRYLQRNIYPEVVLYIMLQHEETAAHRLLDRFSEQRGTDLDRLERQVRVAMENRQDKGYEGRSSPSSRVWRKCYVPDAEECWSGQVKH